MWNRYSASRSRVSENNVFHGRRMGERELNAPLSPCLECRRISQRDKLRLRGCSHEEQVMSRVEIKEEPLHDEG
jgi:hypothetical protein